MKQIDMEGGRSAWIKHVMKYKKPGMSLGDAMKAAKKTWKKTGGTLMDKMGPMGGRRRKTAKVGGTAYGFTGGPYTDSELTDGAGRFPAMSDATWKGPSELLGGRRRIFRRRRLVVVTARVARLLPRRTASRLSSRMLSRPRPPKLQ